MNGKNKKKYEPPRINSIDSSFDQASGATCSPDGFKATAGSCYPDGFKATGSACENGFQASDAYCSTGFKANLGCVTVGNNPR